MLVVEDGREGSGTRAGELQVEWSGLGVEAIMGSIDC